MRVVSREPDQNQTLHIKSTWHMENHAACAWTRPPPQSALFQLGHAVDHETARSTCSHGQADPLAEINRPPSYLFDRYNIACILNYMS
jgi:hypothetical protein